MQDLVRWYGHCVPGRPLTQCVDRIAICLPSYLFIPKRVADNYQSGGELK